MTSDMVGSRTGVLSSASASRRSDATSRGCKCKFTAQVWSKESRGGGEFVNKWENKGENGEKCIIEREWQREAVKFVGFVLKRDKREYS